LFDYCIFVFRQLISAKNLPAKNLAEVLSEDGRFSSLVTAASKADLVGALQGG
jgi:hypothetical protein